MNLKLSNPTIFKDQALINGKWVDSLNGRTYPVLNPATGEKITDVPDMGAGDAKLAIEDAKKAGKVWASKTAKQRAQIIRRWFDLIVENREDLALLLTAEQGKPLSEARTEVDYGAAFVEWFAEEAKRINGDVIPGPSPDKRIVVMKQPIGVVAAITPWNFPIAMITRKVAPALAAGCSIVVKPAEDTPLSALAIAELALQAGVDSGVFNVVTASQGKEIGEELATNNDVRKVSFTGSTQVGRILLSQSADTVKKVSLELGGNAPFIIFGDANLDNAVQGVIACKFRNGGQTCVSANRIYVHDSIYDTFSNRLATEVEKIKVGNGFEPDVNQGPLINAKALKKVEEHIADALSKGAQIITGGRRHSLGGTFFEPTILVDVNNEMQLNGEETFGPVAPLIRFSSEEDVINKANDTEFGLASYFYTNDVSRAWRVAEFLETGMVGINTGVISNEMAPFGGVKQSGLGREGSSYGIDDYVELKYVCMGGI